MQTLFPFPAPRVTIQLIREEIQAYQAQGPIISDYHGAVACVPDLALQDREHFIALYLDCKNRVICQHTVGVGTLTQTLANPREIFKAALLANACSMIVLHNHPSGSTMPSEADLTLTKRLAQCCELMDIKLLDHLIVSLDKEPRSLRAVRPDIFSD